MPKYLFMTSYSAEGARGIAESGGTARRDAIAETIRNAGGTLECCYFAFGDTDLIAIVDLPDNASAAAISLTANASGMLVDKTVVLLSPEEMDRAAQKTVSFRPPGQ